MAKILITGATGFLGRALARALSAPGHAVTALSRRDGDVAEAATWGRLPAADHVFHLAGRSYVPDSWSDPPGFIHANVTGTAQALDYCRAVGAHLVFPSVALFGAPKRLPVREDDPLEPANPYALSKLLAERLCAFYASTFDVAVTVIRLFNVFGPGQRGEFLIPAILGHVLKGEEIRVKTLDPRRDFVFLDDVVEALIRTLDDPRGQRVINIGSGLSHSVQEVIAAVQAAAGTHLPVASEEEERPNEIPDVRADIARARDLLGWQPRTSFAEGIAKLVQAERAAKPTK
jgi:nucleoside-diphosphate-sugar epimerase